MTAATLWPAAVSPQESDLMQVPLRAFSTAVALCLLAGCASRSAPPPPTGPAAAGRIAMAALDVDPEDVYIRIVDVGPGLCAVITVPGGHSMVYDAGHWLGQHCVRAVRELVTGDTIGLLVISHSDADHLGDAARILREKRVLYTILAGEPRTTASWRNFVDALADEVRDGGSVLNVQSMPLVPGTTLPLGEAVVTLVAGWPRWDDPDLRRASGCTRSASSSVSIIAAGPCSSRGTPSGAG